MKRRPPSFKASIVRLDALLARYASRSGILDALNALAILEDSAAPLEASLRETPQLPGGDGTAGRFRVPTLTELVVDRLRSARGRARAVPPLTVGELFDRRLAAFSPAQERSTGSVRAAGAFFRRAFGADAPVELLSREEILRALDRHRHPRTWNSGFAILRAACNWAVGERLIDRSPMAGMRPKRIAWKEPGFLPPDRVERIFRAAEAHPGAAESGIGAFLSLSFFAGVRTAEILRARWEDFDPDGAVFRVPRPKGFARGRKPRIVELEPNAAAWLRRWRDWTAAHAGAAAGRIVRDEHDVRNWKALRLAPDGLSWSDNAGRHTYATMHVGAFRNAAATALNLGHLRGTGLLDRHYRGLVPRAVAETYWRIFPSSAPLPPPEPLPGRGFRSDLKSRPEVPRRANPPSI